METSLKARQSINPPIRGSIVGNRENLVTILMYQSPYKGFNRRLKNVEVENKDSINPPIRGSIDNPLFDSRAAALVSIPL